MDLKELLAPGIRALRSHWGRVHATAQFPSLYPMILAHTHLYLSHSIPLLEDALAYTPQGPLGNYLETHIGEEEGHAEWLLEDLKVLGYGEDYVRLVGKRAPMLTEMVEAQYQANKQDPSSLLGYMWVLEAYQPPPESFALLANHYGLPLHAFSTFKRHAEVDPHHAQDLESLLGTVEPKAPTQSALRTLQALLNYAWMLFQVARGYQERTFYHGIR